MRFEVKRRFLLGFLVLTTLFLAWNLFITGGKMEKIVHAKDAKELVGTVTIKQKKGQRLLLSKLEYPPGSPKFYGSPALPRLPLPPPPPLPCPEPLSPPPYGPVPSPYPQPPPSPVGNRGGIP